MKETLAEGRCRWGKGEEEDEQQQLQAEEGKEEDEQQQQQTDGGIGGRKGGKEEGREGREVSMFRFCLSVCVSSCAPRGRRGRPTQKGVPC